jgi:trehalose-6-phosphate synthase
VVLLQIAMPSRCRIEAYRALQAELAGLVGEINGRHGEVDWTPIRYLSKGSPSPSWQATIASPGSASSPRCMTG